MAISPPSDIVLDVTRAANPLRQQVAFERLSRMSAPGTGATEFASLVDDTTATTGSIEKAPGLAGAREKLAVLHPPRSDGSIVDRLSAAAGTTDSQTDKTLRKFEAQVVSTFIEQMMPESTGNTYGEGMAGGVWRSMLAEQIAGEVAKNGGLGIREKVLAAIQTRFGTAAGTEPAAAADPVASLARTLDRSVANAGASSRDLRIPLALEERFLDRAGPAPSAGGRNSIFRQA